MSASGKLLTEITYNTTETTKIAQTQRLGRDHGPGPGAGTMGRAHEDFFQPQTDFLSTATKLHARARSY